MKKKINIELEFDTEEEYRKAIELSCGMSVELSQLIKDTLKDYMQKNDSKTRNSFVSWAIKQGCIDIIATLVKRYNIEITSKYADRGTLDDINEKFGAYWDNYTHDVDCIQSRNEAWYSAGLYVNEHEKYHS